MPDAPRREKVAEGIFDGAPAMARRGEVRGEPDGWHEEGAARLEVEEQQPGREALRADGVRRRAELVQRESH